MSEKRYDKLLGQLGIFFSIVVLIISIFFSSWGFSFDMNNYSWAFWVSMALGASITVLQLVGNKDDGKDEVFRIIWLLSYAYGIYTNVMGLSQIRGGISTWTDYILPVIVGAFIEIVPEKLFLTSLRKLNSLKSQAIKQDTQSKPVATASTAPLFNPRDVRGHNNRPAVTKPIQKDDLFGGLFGKGK